MTEDIETRLCVGVFQKGAVNVRRACESDSSVYSLGFCKITSYVDEETKSFAFPELFTDVARFGYGSGIVVAGAREGVTNIAPLAA